MKSLFGFIGFWIFLTSSFASEPQKDPSVFQVEMALGRVFLMAGGEKKPLSSKDRAVSGLLMLEKKSVVILLYRGQRFRIQGELTLNLSDLIKNLHRADEFLSQSARSQAEGRKFLLNIRPSMAMGVRAEEQKTEAEPRWITEEPEDSPDLLQNRIRDHYLKGEFEALFGLLTRFNEETDLVLRPETLYYAGAAFFEVQEFPKALKMLEDYLNRSKESETLRPSALYLAALSAFYLEKFADAVKMLEKMIRQSPRQGEAAPVYFLLAQSYAAAGNKNRCEFYLKKILSDFPESPLVEEAESLLRENAR